MLEQYKTNCTISVPNKYAHMLSEVDYEGRDSGYWLYSKKGFQFKDMGGETHSACEHTKADALKMIRSLAPCNCRDCLKWIKRFSWQCKHFLIRYRSTQIRSWRNLLWNH